MKELLTMMLILPFSLLAQYENIPPKAKVIHIKGVGFDELCQRLADSGYVIDRKDKELKTVLTQYKQYPKSWNAGYSIYARVKDSVAILTASFTAPYSRSILSPALLSSADPLFKDEKAYHDTNRKGRTNTKSLLCMPFLWMHSFALSFGKPLEYKLQ